jgi:hypothetical protein
MPSMISEPTADYDTPSDVEIVIELDSINAEQLADATATFVECELFASRGFGGQNLLSVIAKPTQAIFKKVADWVFAGLGKGVKLKLKVGKAELNLENYSALEVEKILESPAFQKALRELRKP